jgi:hypothetical protein
MQQPGWVHLDPDVVPAVRKVGDVEGPARQRLKYVSPHPASRVSRTQIELADPHAVPKPIEYGDQLAPGAVRSIASVGARQKASFSLGTISFLLVSSNSTAAGFPVPRAWTRLDEEEAGPKAGLLFKNAPKSFRYIAATAEMRFESRSLRSASRSIKRTRSPESPRTFPVSRRESGCPFSRP